jgi:hypothetical protein
MHHGRLSVPGRSRAITLGGVLVLAASTLALSAAPVAALTKSPASSWSPAPAPTHAATATVATDTLVELRLADGSTFVGRVVAESADRITFETVGGTRIEIDRAQIRSISPVRGRVVDGVYWREDPNRTRLLLVAPTGRSLRQGEGYVSTFWVAFPFVAYGISDNFTVAGGTPLFPGVVGRVIYLAPKFQVVSTPTMEAAVGVLALFATQELDSGSAGIGYGVATFGNTDRSVSTGAGWAFALGDGDGWISDEPLLMLGGEYRVSRSVKLLTENYFLLSESGSLVTGGVRLFGERLSADFGLGAVVARGSGDVPWFPLLNFVYNFGP